jgi:hypothetical protein
MAKNIATKFTKSFRIQTGGSGFVPYRSAPAHR